ncbi:HAMP domain-containing sensor histidine kinase [Clostridium aestuarii]|uniref:histidine kinase n=1 Tax=Clostridium aestuarii TaxID=338193 RepID=A0ABT4CZT6_9CLOT|nr:HAMP domain-containing sensor histidine kinase [Clostridium aestuarii]MCY6484494.1 HAMP domain-containing sensor histidine kinase [Clostridium aestuarii]
MKRINKKSITFKLFIVTTVFFISFISIQLIFQSLFFEKFYINKKTNKLKIELESFQKDYIKNLKRSTQTIRIIEKFEQSNNAKIVILESNGLLNYITNYEDELKDSTRVNVIKGIIQEWTSDPKAFIDLQNKGEAITYIFDSKFYNIKNIVCVSPVVINNIPVKVIFAVSSLQPVNEAADVIKEYYIYIYIAAVVLILILSFVYSEMISRPLVNLNKKATKMSKFDFTEKCDANREDEIGNLAATLNFLSENLNKALNSLRSSNKKLKKDIEKEKKLEKMRKEFVASVSHELKTPISLIEGYAEGVKDNIVQGEEREYYLDVIIDEAQKMGRLVADMLELSRMESGTFKMNMNEFILDETIIKTIKRLKNLNYQNDEENNIEIIMDVQDNLKVLGDENKIEEAITNFLTNAIRHTKNQGKIIVRAFIKQDKVWVEVENEGNNIPEGQIEKIWDKFYRIDKSRNRMLGGTGLGLAIVKNILELHHSEYGAENTKIGVKFYFSMKKN